MRTKKITILIITLFSVAALVSAGMIIKEFAERRQDITNFEKLEDLIATPETEATTDQDNSSEIEPNPVETECAQSTHNLEPLFEKNADCIGWLCIQDTSVNYPVMYTPQEPEKYLRRNFEGEYSFSGVPFLKGEFPPECDNLIIYGHNMKNGTMFSDITKYREKEFCEEHPCIEFETADELKTYQVFAVVCLNKTDEWYGYSVFENETQYHDVVAEIKERSLYDTKVEPQYGQQLITLSTCYGNSKDGRIIVIGTEQKGSSTIIS